MPKELQESFSDFLVQNEFEPVKNKLNSMLIFYKNELPEVAYFMDVFAENCLVSVDKLAEQDS